MHWPACAYANADKCIYFQQDMRLIILTLACKGFLISGRCHVRFATLVDKKRDVRDDIKYTWTNLKIVRLGIARTHGWVELAPTVQTSSSQRGSTVFVLLKLLEYACYPQWFTGQHTRIGTFCICKKDSFIPPLPTLAWNISWCARYTLI